VPIKKKIERAVEKIEEKVEVVCITEKVNQVNIRTVIQLLHYNGECSINA